MHVLVRKALGTVRNTAEAAALALSISAAKVFWLGSTGVIGKQIPMDK